MELGHITVIIRGFSEDFGSDRGTDEPWHDWFFRKISDSPDIKDRPHDNFHKFERNRENNSFLESKETVTMTTSQFKKILKDTASKPDEIVRSYKCTYVFFHFICSSMSRTCIYIALHDRLPLGICGRYERRVSQLSGA